MKMIGLLSALFLITALGGMAQTRNVKQAIVSEEIIFPCKSGQWAFVGNDINNGRYQLSIYISDDEGSTWKWKELIEYAADRKGSFSYPLGDGKKSIKHVVIDPKKIVQ
jgi:hypothetical protein